MLSLFHSISSPKVGKETLKRRIKQKQPSIRPMFGIQLSLFSLQMSFHCCGIIRKAVDCDADISVFENLFQHLRHLFPFQSIEATANPIRWKRYKYLWIHLNNTAIHHFRRLLKYRQIQIGAVDRYRYRPICRQTPDKCLCLWDSSLCEPWHWYPGDSVQGTLGLHVHQTASKAVIRWLLAGLALCDLK